MYIYNMCIFNSQIIYIYIYIIHTIFRNTHSAPKSRENFVETKQIHQELMAQMDVTSQKKVKNAQVPNVTSHQLGCAG